MMRKLNIGAGALWRSDGWETLDSGTTKFKSDKYHHGVIWDMPFDSNSFDIVFASHILEHVPHYRIQKSLSEVNRILKPGGIFRLAVPDLNKAAKAYVSGDVDFFRRGQTRTHEDLGMGGMLMDYIVSPGHQTLAIMPDFSEVIGRYAHIYSYDFTMMKVLLSQWGFSEIVKSEFCASSIVELQQKNIITDGVKEYNLKDQKALKRLEKDKELYFTGFDNKPEISLYVESKKEKYIPFNMTNGLEYFNRGQVDSRPIIMKLAVARYVGKLIDGLAFIYRKMRFK